MEVLNELPSHKPFAIFDYTEPSPRFRSGELKDNSRQPLLFQGMEHQMPSIKSSGEIFNRSTRVNEMTGWEPRHHHLFVDDKELPTSVGAIDGKNSKIGWILSTNEIPKGQNGIYLSSSKKFKLSAVEDGLLQTRNSPVHGYAELSHLRPNSSNGCSDGSISVLSSSEGCQLDQFMDYMFDKNETIDYPMGSLDDQWFPDPVDFPYSCPISSDQISYTSKSGNSSDCSNDDGMPQERHISFKVQNELEASSHENHVRMTHTQPVQDTGLWQKQHRGDGLEEIFSPRSVGQAEVFSSGMSTFNGGQICFGGTDTAGITPAGGFHYTVSVQGDTSAIPFSSKPSQPEKDATWQIGMPENSILNFSNYSREPEGTSNNSSVVTPQQNSKLINMNGAIEIRQDTTREFGLNPILGSPLKSAKSETEYSEICLVHLLIAGAEAVATRDMDLASVILVRLKELVSCSGSTMQRVAAYFCEALQSRIDGGNAIDNADYSKDQSEILAAFQILHGISPYIKFGHFTANQAILEAVEGEKNVHIVDFEIMEGIQWPPLMQALSSRKGGPPQLKITALFRPQAEGGRLVTVQETGKRLTEFALSVNIPFSFTPLRVNNDEEASLSNIKLIKGEALVVNCMVHLPHMPHRTVTSVSSFLHGIHRYSPVVLTLVEEELGCSASPVASYFFEALHHYSAICDSLEVCLANEMKARMLVERLFLAPRINSTVRSWSGSSAQPDLGAEFPTYNWCSLVRSAGFKSLPLSFQNFSQAKLLLGLHKDGFKLDPISNRLILGWQGRHMGWHGQCPLSAGCYPPGQLLSCTGCNADFAVSRDVRVPSLKDFFSALATAYVPDATVSIKAFLLNLAMVIRVSPIMLLARYLWSSTDQRARMPMFLQARSSVVSYGLSSSPMWRYSGFIRGI